MYRITYIGFKIVYLNVITSNTFTINLTIATATSESIIRTTIGGTAGTLSDINTIATITITDKARNLRILNTVIGTTTIATILIEIIITILVITQITTQIIQILMANIILLIVIELAE